MKTSLTLLILILLIVITLLIWVKSAPLGIALAAYFFLLTDIPFQGLTLTHGIPTALSLIMILTATWLARTQPRRLKATALISGGIYAVFAQLFTPLLFASLFAYLPAILDSASRKTESRIIPRTLFKLWAIGYFFTISFHFLLGFLFSSENTRNEIQDGVSTRVTHSLSNLLRIMYLQIVVTPSNYPLRFAGALILLMCVGYFIGVNTREIRFKQPQLKNLENPLLYIAIWLFSLGGHDGHGWVGNLIWIMPLILIFQIYLTQLKKI